MFTLVHFGRYLFKKLYLHVNRQYLWSHTPTLVSTSVVMFRVLYLYLTRTSFDVLNCTSTDPPEFRDPINKRDPIEYMSGMIEYPCWEPHSWQVFLFPFGLGTLVLYAGVLPGLAMWHLRRNRVATKTDQILRAQGIGDDKLTNPRFLVFRQMWSKLYYHFKPGKWYWE